MFCVYEWDDRRELMMVTVADGFGLRWYQVMTWGQWQEVVDLAEVTGQLDLLNFRALVLRVLDG